MMPRSHSFSLLRINSNELPVDDTFQRDLYNMVKHLEKNSSPCLRNGDIFALQSYLFEFNLSIYSAITH